MTEVQVLQAIPENITLFMRPVSNAVEYGLTDRQKDVDRLVGVRR